MLSYNLTPNIDDTVVSSSLGGLSTSVPSLSYTSIQNDPLNFVSDLVGSIIPGADAVIDGTLNLLGIGPDDWADVEARTRAEVVTIIEYGQNKYFKDATVSDYANALTEFDRYIMSDAQYRLDVTKSQTASNSINRGKLMYELLHEYINNFRTSLTDKFTYVLTSGRVQGSGITSYKNAVFNHSFIDSIKYASYTVKAGGSNLDGDISSITAFVPSSIPTDSEYLGGDEAESTSKFNWLFVVIPVAVVAIGMGVKWLYKKFKK